MNQRANAALAGCAASPLPWWPCECVSAHTPRSVFLASGRMMFLHHNQVHLKSFRSNAQSISRVYCQSQYEAVITCIWSSLLGIFFLLIFDFFTNSRVVALGELMILLLKNSFIAISKSSPFFGKKFSTVIFLLLISF